MTEKDDPYRMCPKCGTCMIVDIATLNKIDWYCPKCEPTIEEWQYTGITLEGKKELIVEFIQFLGYFYQEWYPQMSEKMKNELWDEKKKWEAKVQ